jgi:hypothetical protein
MSITSVRLVTAAAALLAIAGPTSASLRVVDVVPFGQPNGVACVGSYAVYGVGHGLMVVDPSEPSSPRVVSRLALPGEVHSLAVFDDLVWVADGSAGARAVDLSDPAHPQETMFLATPGVARSVVVNGGWALIADGDLQAVSLDPGAVLSGSIELGGASIDLVVSGDTAFVAAAHDGLYVIDVSSPLEMTEIAHLQLQSYAVEQSQDHLFVAAGSAGLRVFNVATPGYPIEIGSLSTPTEAISLSLSGDVLALGTTADMRLIDVSTPASPSEIGAVEILGGARALVVSGERVYVTRAATTAPIIDIAAPQAPAVAGQVFCDRAGDAVVAADLVLVTLGDPNEEYVSGFTILDLTALPGHAELSTVKLEHSTALAAQDTFVYVAGNGLLQVFDISNPGQPDQVATMPLPYPAIDIAVGADLLVVSDQTGLRVVDVSNPLSPNEIGFTPSDRGYGELAVAGDHVYAGWGYVLWEGYSGSMAVYDLESAATPVEITSVTTGKPVEILFRGERTYVLGWGGSLGMVWPSVAIFDTSSPADPRELRQLESAEYYDSQGDLAMLGRWAILANNGRVHVASTSVPWSSWGPPVPDLEGVVGLATYGSHVLAASWDHGLSILEPTWADIDPVIDPNSE